MTPTLDDLFGDSTYSIRSFFIIWNESSRMYSSFRKIPDIAFLLELLGSVDEGTHVFVEVAIWVHDSFYGLIKARCVIPFGGACGPLSL